VGDSVSSTKEALSIATDRQSSGRDIKSGELTALARRFCFLRELKSADKTRYFLARDYTSNVDQLVRVAVLSTDVVEEPSELLAFLVEAQAAAKLSHKNIARSEKPEPVEGLHFYVSQYPESAETLRSLLDQKGWFEVSLFLKIASQIAHALHYAHQAEVLHLKLQPEDVLIDSDDKVTLTGFGIPSRPARPWIYQKRSQQCPLIYRSPEQLANNHLDERSDLYTLGVLLYEMLTDVLPFNAQDENQLRQKIAIHKAPLVHLIRPEIPESLSAIVAKLIAANPAERFQDAAELRSALAHLADSLSQESPVQQEPPVTETAQQSEGENDLLAVTLEDHYKFLPYRFENETEPLSLDFTDVEEGVDFKGWRPEKFSDDTDWLLLAEPKRLLQSPASAKEPSQTDKIPSHLLAAESGETTQVIAAEANRRESFPFLLLAIGVAIITAISVLAFTGNLQGFFNPATASEQTTSSAASSSSATPNTLLAVAQETSQAPASDASPQANNSKSSDTLAIPESTQPSLETSSPTPLRTRPDTSRLRQQLRQINKAKATNQKIKKANSKARPLRAKPRRGFFRWRPW
jgi:serine/threonine protein kinase